MKFSLLAIALSLTSSCITIPEFQGAAAAQDTPPKFAIPEKTKTLTVRVKGDEIAAKFVALPGSRVDVFETVAEKDGTSITRVVLANVMIVAVNTTIHRQETILSVDVAVPQAEIQRLSKVIVKEKFYTLGLRRIGDDPPTQQAPPVPPSGKRAVALRIADPRLPLAALPGTIVDILATTRSADGKTEGRVLAQKVHVLAADQSPNPRRLGDNFIVTVEVTDEDAWQLGAAIVEANTVLHVVVRKSGRK